MSHLLETNACIRYLNRRNTGIERRLKALQPEDVAVCAVVKAELFYGAMKSTDPERALARQEAFLQAFRSFPFDDDAARHYARIRAELARKGTPIGANDMLIAAIALAHNLTLVTHNTGEFGRVAGPRVEDWEDP